MRRVKHQVFVTSLLRYASDACFTLLFIFFAYTAQAQDQDSGSQVVHIDTQIVADHIQDQLADDLSIQTVDGTEQVSNELVVKINDDTSAHTINQIEKYAISAQTVLQTDEQSYIKIVVPEDQKKQIVLDYLLQYLAEPELLLLEQLLLQLVLVLVVVGEKNLPYCSSAYSFRCFCKASRATRRSSQSIF